MTIVFTGGGTGGHFYPLIAIAESIEELVHEKHLIAPKLYFLAPDPFDEKALFEKGIGYFKVPAGKMRRNAFFGNIGGFFTTLGGIISGTYLMFTLYPDVVISKGGYGSVPTTVAARILGIPVIIHESDARPGRANLLASKWAKKIAISFPDAAKYFPKKVQSKIARTGIPVRKALTAVQPEGARQYLNFEPGVPTILILGGSQGSTRINEMVLLSLPDLISFANVIHQTGRANFTEVENVSEVVLSGNPHASRYHVFDYLSEGALERAAGVCDLVISRAGATSIAEIAAWKRPALLIPIPEDISHDQKTNAYSFAQTGAAVVLEQANLTPHILASEARRIATDPELAKSMGAKGAQFADIDAGRVLAEEALAIALSHETV